MEHEHRLTSYPSVPIVAELVVPTYLSKCVSSLVIFSVGVLKDVVLPFAGVPQLVATARCAKPMTCCSISSHCFSRMPYECTQGRPQERALRP